MRRHGTRRVLYPCGGSGIWVFAVLGESGYSTDVRDGFQALFWADVVVTAGVTTFVIVGCFHALRPDRQAFHDLAAGTAVFNRRGLVAARGFTPQIAPGTCGVVANAPLSALSVSSQGQDAGPSIMR